LLNIPELLLPSEYNPITQPISENLVFYKLEKVLGRSPNDEDRKFLSRCRCVEDFMVLIAETYIGDVFIKGSGIGLGRLGEFYVSLRCEKAVEWEPTAGYDLWGAWRYEDLVKGGKVEVKTSAQQGNYNWSVRIAGQLSEFVADVVVFVCLDKSLNPCREKMFVIPRDALIDTFCEQKTERPHDRPRISIAKTQINNNTGQQNRWYEYLLMDHTKLKERIGEYVFGQFSILGMEQLSLF